MATLARTTPNVTHYAYYGDLYGTAELVRGSGYLFREEGERTATLVSPRDAEQLMLLLGLVVESEMQADLDTLLGGPVWIATHRQMEVV
jgi:hypothetical protein